MFVAPAYAQGAAAGGGMDLFATLVPMVAIVAIFWLLMIRPQQKKANEHRARLAAIRRGDRVVTGGGFLGLVTKVNSDTELTVEIAEGVRVAVLRATIADVLAKAEPARREPPKKAEAGKGEPRPAETAEAATPDR